MGILGDIGNDLVDKLSGSESSKVELRAALLDGDETGGYLVFTIDGIEFHPDIVSGPDQELYLSAEHILDVQITGRDETHERFTLTRLLLFKQLALAFPKRKQTQDTMLDVLLSDNTRVSFYVEDLSPQDAWRQIAHIVNSYSAEQVSESAYQPSLSEELERLAVLHDNGSLSDQEFTDAKQALIDNDTSV